MNKVNRILRRTRKPEKVATSAAQLREAVEAKWGAISSKETATDGDIARVPVIICGWGYNVWKHRLTLKRVDLIEVDDVLRVRLAALETAFLRELPAWRAQNKRREYISVWVVPYTFNEYKRIQIQYSEARNNK